MQSDPLARLPLQRLGVVSQNGVIRARAVRITSGGPPRLVRRLSTNDRASQREGRRMKATLPFCELAQRGP